MLTVGLFGTCGNSHWREAFIKKYEELGISFFNPQVLGWDQKNAKNEAWHLANDKIILFPVTNESYGSGSLAEMGFYILNAIKQDKRRSFVVMIATDLAPELTDSFAKKESLRVRKLLSKHLQKLQLSDLYIVNTLEEMLEISIPLYRAAEMILPLEKYNP